MPPLPGPGRSSDNSGSTPTSFMPIGHWTDSGRSRMAAPSPNGMQAGRVTAPMTTPASRPHEAMRHHNEGHGRRLTSAFEALEAFPALAESRNRLLRLVSAERVSPADIVATVESDIALVIAVMRLANRHAYSRGKV